MTTDVKGERRFIATIARRLDGLGALTRGQRDSQTSLGGADARLFRARDNLESPYARAALRQFYGALWAGYIPDWSLDRFETATGLKLTWEGSLNENLPPMRDRDPILAHARVRARRRGDRPAARSLPARRAVPLSGAVAYVSPAGRRRPFSDKETPMAPTNVLPDKPVYAFCPEYALPDRPPADSHRVPGPPGLRAHRARGADARRCGTPVHQTQRAARAGPRRLDGARGPGHAGGPGTWQSRYSLAITDESVLDAPARFWPPSAPLPVPNCSPIAAH